MMSGWIKMFPTNYSFTKKDSALNNLQCVICHKNKQKIEKKINSEKCYKIAEILSKE